MTKRIKASFWAGLCIAALVTSPIDTARAQCDPVEFQKLTASDASAGFEFGQSMSLDGVLGVVGTLADDHAGIGTGSAQVFRFQANEWVEEQKLTASDAARLDFFGLAVTVSGDVIVVGAAGNDDTGRSSGSAYSYRHDGVTWVEEQKITASDAQEWARFGESVSVHGDILVIGASADDGIGDESGSAYIFRYNGVTWVEEQKITASDSEAGDRFGTASLYGEVVAVGAPRDDDSGSESGSVYVFRYNGASWVEEQKLTASDAAADDNFGVVVSLHGDVLVIGASGDDDGGDGSGSAYIFRFAAGVWTEEQKIVASDAAAGDSFGAVSVFDETVVVGASGHGNGSAYVFERTAGTWLEEEVLTASDGAADDRFGSAVSIHKKWVLIGAYLDDDAGDRSGSAYMFSLDGFPAFWRNYGQGWPGTNGVPAFTPSGNPSLGSSVELNIENSLGSDTIGSLLIGLTSATIVTKRGGTLHLLPTSVFSLAIPATGLTLLAGTIPNDPALCGLSVFLQVLENDGGASRGVSFTAGLELQLGRM